MTKVFALARNAADGSLEVARIGIVLATAAALIFAGQALPL